MGYYINPRGETKEEFLEREGTVIDAEDAALTLDAVPVCLVDNGYMTAAGIGYSDEELERFRRTDDNRPKVFYAVPRNVLKVFCNRI